MNKIKIGISLYRIFSRAYFHLPFLTIFFYMQGHNIFQISLLMSVYGLSSFLFSYSLKARIQEKISDRNTLIISELLKLIGLFILISINSNLAYYFAQVLLGISYSLGAGIDSKIIYNEIAEKPDSFQAKSNSYMFNMLLFCGLIGSYLFKINIFYPIIATIIFTIISIISCFLFLPSLKFKNKVTEKKKNFKITLKQVRLISFYSVTRAVILSLFTGFLPYHFVIDLNLSIYQFIIILSSYTLIGSVSSQKSLKMKFNNLPIIVLFLSLSLLLYFSTNIYLITFSTLLLGGCSGMIRPHVVNHLKNEHNLFLCLNIAEQFFSLLNILFLVIGGILYLLFGFNCMILMLLITLVFYFTFLLIINNLHKEI